MNPPLPQRTPPGIDDAGRAQAGPIVRSQVRWRRALVVGTRAALVVLLAVAWELAARRNWIDPFFLPRPSTIVLQLYYWLREGTPIGPLLAQLRTTFVEAGLGFVAGTIAGVCCAIVLARNALLADVFGFYVRLANAVPLIMLGAVFVIGLGLGLSSKVAIAAVLAFFVVVGNALARVRAGDRDAGASAPAHGGPTQRPAVFRAVGCGTLASLRAGFALALAGALVGEFLGARQGIGKLIAISQAEFNASGVFAALIALGAAALVVDGVLAALGLAAGAAARRART
jgi:NitT/TauT family transport system permease protein